MDYADETLDDSDYELIDMDLVSDSPFNNVSVDEIPSTLLDTATNSLLLEIEQPDSILNEEQSDATAVFDTDGSSQLSNLMDDTDYDSEDMSIDNGSNQNRYYDSSDTSDDDLWLGDLSAASSDSSLAEYGENMGFFELMNQHLEIFNHEADSFFRVSLRTLYQTLIEYMEERGGPTPQNIIDSLPTVKVTIAQIASNLTCSVCFAEYEQDEDLLKLPCNHLYHKTCIISWLKLKSTCPTCRLDLSKESNRTSSASTNSFTEDTNSTTAPIRRSSENNINDISNPNSGTQTETLRQTTIISDNNEAVRNTRIEAPLVDNRRPSASSNDITSNYIADTRCTSNAFVNRGAASSVVSPKETCSNPTSSAIMTCSNSACCGTTACSNSACSAKDCGCSGSTVNSNRTHIHTNSSAIKASAAGGSGVVRKSSSTSRTKRSTTLTATTTKRYSRETEIW